MTEIVAKVSPPQDFDALRSVILERKGELPKRLTQVAAYALDHPDEIAFGTAASIAISANVQPSTLVRFAQHFGFEGFSGLQLLFRARLRERTSSYEDRLRTLEQDGQALTESTNIFNGLGVSTRYSHWGAGHLLMPIDCSNVGKRRRVNAAGQRPGRVPPNG